MTRTLTVAAGQLGPNQPGEDRSGPVERMMGLLREAKAVGAGHVAFPELALTTYFPRYDFQSEAELDRYFETTLPGPATQPLFDAARDLGVGFYLGYAEKTPDGRRFNSAVLVDDQGEIVARYRKIHLPGTEQPVAGLAWQALEKRYFTVGDLGFPVAASMGANLGLCICNDRRWAETFRVLGLAAADVVLLGYCTPAESPGAPAWNTPDLRLRQHRLSVQAGAYQNAAFVVAAGKAGVEDGCDYMAGSLIVSPTGEILAEARTNGDELVVAEIDLDVRRYYAKGLFDFARHRRPEHYGPITEPLRPRG